MKKILQKIRKALNKSPIEIHPAFVVFIVFFALTGRFQTAAITTVLALVHELGHGAVAARFGYHLKKIRLMPFGAELCGDDLFLNSHEIKIAIAGPVVNLLICVGAIAVMWIKPDVYALCKEVFMCSLSLGLFNLLPFFPLDGGRVFVALVSKKTSRKFAVKVASVLTLLFGICLCALCAISLAFSFNLSVGIMGVMLVVVSLFPSRKTKYERFTSKAFKRKKLSNGLARREVAILDSAMIITAFSNIDARTQTEFVVQNEDGEEKGRLSESQIENAINDGFAYQKLCEYLDKNH